MGRKRISGAEAAWRDRLGRYEKSGLTVVEFCRREGVSGPSFYQWRKRLRAEKRSQRQGRRESPTPAEAKQASRFVPVSVSIGDTAEIDLPNGATVRLPVSDTDALQAAIGAAGHINRETRPC